MKRIAGVFAGLLLVAACSGGEPFSVVSEPLTGAAGSGGGSAGSSAAGMAGASGSGSADAGTDADASDAGKDAFVSPYVDACSALATCADACSSDAGYAHCENDPGATPKTVPTCVAYCLSGCPATAGIPLGYVCHDGGLLSGDHSTGKPRRRVARDGRRGRGRGRRRGRALRRGEPPGRIRCRAPTRARDS